MISNVLIQSLHNCFKHNAVERSILSFAKTRIYNVLQKYKKWCPRLMWMCAAVLAGMMSMVVFAPLTILNFATTSAKVNVVGLSWFAVSVCFVTFKFAPRFLEILEHTVAQNNKNKVQVLEKTVELLKDLHGYSLPRKAQNALSEVVNRLSDQNVCTATWVKVNTCLSEIKGECRELAIQAEKGHTLQSFIQDLEVKFKPVSHNSLQL